MSVGVIFSYYHLQLPVNKVVIQHVSFVYVILSKLSLSLSVGIVWFDFCRPITCFEVFQNIFEFRISFESISSSLSK